MNLDSIQTFMREQRIDGWLVYDFRLNNPVMARWLNGELRGAGITTPPHMTRRVYRLIPANGEPRLLCQTIDDASFKKLGLKYATYGGWRDMREKVAAMVGETLIQAGGGRRIAMEYSPGGALPTAGIVDAGTIEFVRSLGVEVVSSADLVQLSAAVWQERGLASHQRAIAHCDRIMQQAFAFIDQKLKNAGSGQAAATHEFEVQRFILDQFKQAGLVTDSDPIVGVNGNAADCHYSPDAKSSKPIRRGDWVLIDLWAKEPGEDTVYGDITWTGYCVNQTAPKPTARQVEVFRTVLAARDASVEAAKKAWQAGPGGKNGMAEGWQLDEAARNQIIRAGYEQQIKHRTGHSLSPGTVGAHGIGMNLDTMETYDTRRAMPGTGFTVEPGIYLDGDFGVRSEVNLYVDPAKGPVVTGEIQREIVMMG